jgi:ABC-2 type transport system ATP-binding protein
MPASYKKRIGELAEVLALGPELRKPVKAYSGGMKRKLEVIRSLIHQPRVLFLDEPTTGLDPLSRRSLWEYLKDVRRQNGTTTLLTTHYLEEAEDADRVCILNKGQVVSLGAPDDVKRQIVQEYVIADVPDSDRATLQTELTAKGLRFVEELGHFRLELDDRSVHQLLKAIDTPLSRVQVHTPTLEDAYLEIIGATAKVEE